MAKRKKLNKRVVVFLSIFSVVLVTLVVAFVIGKLPKDPQLYYERGKAERARAQTLPPELQREAYEKAAKNLAVAIEQSGESDVTYLYEMVQLQLDVLKLRLPEAEQMDRLRMVFNLLRTAMRRDPQFVDGQQLLTDLTWEMTVQSRRWEDFITECDRLIELDPDNHQAYMRRGLAKGQMARSLPATYTEAAIEDLRRAVELKSDEAQYWLSLIGFYQTLGRSEDAEQEYARALEVNPDEPRLRVAYSNFLQARDRSDEARAQIQEAIERAPESTSGYVALAEFHRRENDMEGSLKALEQAKAVDNTDYLIYQFMAEVYNRMRQPDQAAGAVRDGLAAISKGFEQADSEELTEARRARLEQARRQLSYILANLLLDQSAQQPARKEELVAEVRGLLPQIEQIGPDSPQYAKTSGRLAIADGDYDKAAELLEQADAGFNGGDAQSAALLINLYSARMPSKAEEIVDRLLKSQRFQNEPQFLLKKAEFEIRYRRFAEAQEYVDRALRADPQNEAALRVKAQLGAIAATDEGLASDVELTPWAVQQLTDQAQQIWATGEQDEAVRMLEDLHQRVPDDLKVVDSLAGFYLSRKQNAEAQALLLDAEKYHPDNEALQTMLRSVGETDPEKQAAIWLELAEKTEDPFQRALQKAQIYARLGDDERYRNALEEAARINPQAPTVIEQQFRYALLHEDWQSAEGVVQRVGEHNLDEVQGRLFQARLHLARKEVPDAVKLLEAIHQERPDSKRVAVMLGESYLMQKDYASAKQAFAAVTAVDMSYAPAVVGMAEALLGQGDPEAPTWVERAHRLTPQNQRVQRMYLAIREEQAAPEQLIAERERLLSQNPDDMENRFHLGRLYTRTKQYDKAEAMYLAIWENPEANKAGAARILVSFYAETNQYRKGITVLEQLLSQTEDKVAAYILYGDFLSRFNTADAAKAYKKAISADPKDGRGYLATASFLGEQKQWTEAAAQTEKYLELDPDSREQRRNLVRYRIDGGELDAAQTDVDRLLASDPSDAEAYVLAGALAMQRSDYARAEELFSRALRENPKSFEAYDRRHRVYLARGELQLARRDLEEARKVSDDPRLGMGLANVLKNLGDFQGAEFVYNEILQSRPGYEPAIRALLGLLLQRERWQAMEPLLMDAKARFPTDASYLMLEGQMWKVRGNGARSVAAMESALRIDPGYGEALRVYLDMLLSGKQYDAATALADRYMDKEGFAWVQAVKARIAAERGQADQADELFREVLAVAPASELRYLVIQASATYGQDEVVAKFAEWVSQVRGDDWQAHLLLGSMWSERKEHDKAITAYRTALDLADTPKDKASVNQSLGTMYYLLGQFSEAEKAYLQVLQAEPNDLVALNNLAYMYTVDLNQPDKALPHAERAAALMPNDGSVADTYGWALFKVNKVREAEEQLSRSVQLAQRQATNRYHLGRVLELRGRLSDAAREYREASAIAREQNDERMLADLELAMERVQRKISGEEQ